MKKLNRKSANLPPPPIFKKTCPCTILSPLFNFSGSPLWKRYLKFTSSPLKRGGRGGGGRVVQTMNTTHIFQSSNHTIHFRVSSSGLGGWVGILPLLKKLACPPCPPTVLPQKCWFWCNFHAVFGHLPKVSPTSWTHMVNPVFARSYYKIILHIFS